MSPCDKLVGADTARCSCSLVLQGPGEGWEELAEGLESDLMLQLERDEAHLQQMNLKESQLMSRIHQDQVSL